jgi:RNA polymerase sigma-70 factor, ECF subfamily
VLLAAQGGAEWALARLYRDFHPPVLRYLRVQEPAEAEDLASEVWLDVGPALSRFSGDEPAFRRWLFTIAHRRVVDLRRRRRRQQTDPVAPEGLPELRDQATAESEALASIAAESMLACIASLPADQAEVILLRVVAGFDSNEVAAVMGKKRGTVRVLQHRALERLADLVEHERRAGVTR